MDHALGNTYVLLHDNELHGATVHVKVLKKERANVFACIVY